MNPNVNFSKQEKRKETSLKINLYIFLDVHIAVSLQGADFSKIKFLDVFWGRLISVPCGHAFMRKIQLVSFYKKKQ